MVCNLTSNYYLALYVPCFHLWEVLKYVKYPKGPDKANDQDMTRTEVSCPLFEKNVPCETSYTNTKCKT